MADDALELSVLPLGEVLLPGMKMRLSARETDHLAIVRRCLERDEPFGVLLSSFDVKGGDRLCHSPIGAVGTVARILNADWGPGGSCEVSLLGVSRFRVPSGDVRSSSRPTVRLLEEVQGDAGQCRRFAARVVSVFAEYVSLLLTLTHRSMSELTLPTDLLALSYAVAASLWTGQFERQRLLAAASVEDRLRLELLILERERGLLAAKMPERRDPFAACRALPLN